MLSKDTGWWFLPNSVTAVRQEELDPDETAYPIKIHYEPFARMTVVMSVLDRKQYPDEIVLYVNISNLTDKIECIDEKNARNFIHSKVSHEFGHIRENYGRFYISTGKSEQKKAIDVSQTKRYVTSCIERFFEVPSRQDELDQIYEVISDIMYLFSPTEMTQRIRETYDFVSLYTTDEMKAMYVDVSDNPKKWSLAGDRYKLTAQFFDMTQSVHYYSQMQEMIQNVYSCRGDGQGLRHALTLAYYFKYYRIYRTSDPLSKKLVEHLWDADLKAEEISRYNKYFDRFYNFLQKTLRDFKHKLFAVIFAVLHGRLWESWELDMFGCSYYEESTDFRYDDLRALLESTTETRFV